MRSRAIVQAAVVVVLIAGPGWGGIYLEAIGTYSTGVFDDDAAIIVAHDPETQRLFVANRSERCIDILDITDPENPVLDSKIDLSGYGVAPTSVAVSGGIVAVALESDPVTDPGVVVFFDADGEELAEPVTVGALPDMITFTPDGTRLLVANEGEPSDDYTIDPEGSITIIEFSVGVESLTVDSVLTADFAAFNGQEEELRELGVRIYGPGASVAQDLEPEFIAVSDDSATAWVTLQENNAVATIDLASATVTQVVGLGYKQHRTPGNGLDASNKDDMIKIARWPVLGMYQPDGMAAFTVGGETYLVTANEGDVRGYDGFSEDERVKDLALGKGLLRSHPDLEKKKNLGRLKVTTAPPRGKTVHPRTGEERYNMLFSFGARSFSIWTTDAVQVYDSGDDLEQITAVCLPDDFNSTDDENDSRDSRSDDKGPEPESVVVGEVEGHTYAFIGLERVGGIMVYDISDPHSPVFQDYVNNRNFGGDPEGGTAGDLSPEGVIFIAGSDSPTGEPLLAVANQVSGTTTIFRIIGP